MTGIREPALGFRMHRETIAPAGFQRIPNP
jgi:hypothetical protein